MADVTVTLTALTMDGLPAVDPHVTVQIREVAPFQRALNTVRISDFEGDGQFGLKLPDGANPTWSVGPGFSRYVPVGANFFLPLAEPDPKFNFQLTRLPSAWKPKFTPFIALSSPRFDAFKAVVDVSHSVDLKSGPPVGDLAANYDAIDNNAQILAKTALLNLYSVLCEEKDPVGKVAWFSYVRTIVRLDEERFLAEVDKALYTNVLTILTGLHGAFADQGYSTEPPEDQALHTPNIPPQYDFATNLVQMITLKIAYEQGDVQLTVSLLNSVDGPIYLLDCDMDEHLDILAHAVDIAEHVQTGGTNPLLMHEYIVRKSAREAADGVSTVDLGYVLV
jgi:hypothetical protein